ncbi:MAG: hypothetical protein HY296_08250 [Thaumarchaeota archaeon]|nr:hypothetical protein [Nitrososphaerota archaeon]
MSFDFSIYLSLAFLFGIAAQFRAMDGYTFLRGLIASAERKVGILYAVVIVTSVFSPFILNDVTIIILTPVIIRYAKQFDVDPAPLLVAEITFTNISSSLTPIGNPQNILVWSASGISFFGFVLGTWFPVLVSAVISSLALLPFALREGGSREIPDTQASRRPAFYLGAVAVTVVVADLAGLPPYDSLAFSFFIGFALNLGSIRQVVQEYDFRSLLTLYAFVASISVFSYVAMPAVVSLASPVASGAQPYSALFFAGVSNLISNVPATQLVLNAFPVTPLLAPKIAVEAGLAGNLGPIASFANLLALQMARRSGCPVRKTIILQSAIGLLSFLPVFI